MMFIASITGVGGGGGKCYSMLSFWIVQILKISQLTIYSLNTDNFFSYDPLNDPGFRIWFGRDQTWTVPVEPTIG